MNLTNLPLHVFFIGLNSRDRVRLTAAITPAAANAVVSDCDDLFAVASLLTDATLPVMVFIADSPAFWQDDAIQRLKFKSASKNIAIVICLIDKDLSLLEKAFGQGANVALTMSHEVQQFHTAIKEIIFHFRQHHACDFRKDTFFLIR